MRLISQILSYIYYLFIALTGSYCVIKFNPDSLLYPIIWVPAALGVIGLYLFRNNIYSTWLLIIENYCTAILGLYGYFPEYFQNIDPKNLHIDGQEGIGNLIVAMMHTGIQIGTFVLALILFMTLHQNKTPEKNNQ